MEITDKQISTRRRFKRIAGKTSLPEDVDEDK